MLSKQMLLFCVVGIVLRQRPSAWLRPASRPRARSWRERRGAAPRWRGLAAAPRPRLAALPSRAQGLKQQNRGVEGDEVAIRILPPTEWYQLTSAKEREKAAAAAAAGAGKAGAAAGAPPAVPAPGRSNGVPRLGRAAGAAAAGAPPPTPLTAAVGSGPAAMTPPAWAAGEQRRPTGDLLASPALLPSGERWLVWRSAAAAPAAACCGVGTRCRRASPLAALLPGPRLSLRLPRHLPAAHPPTRSPAASGGDLGVALGPTPLKGGTAAAAAAELGSESEEEEGACGCQYCQRGLAGCRRGAGARRQLHRCWRQAAPRAARHRRRPHPLFRPLACSAGRLPVGAGSVSSEGGLSPDEHEALLEAAEEEMLVSRASLEPCAFLCCAAGHTRRRPPPPPSPPVAHGPAALWKAPAARPPSRLPARLPACPAGPAA